jgi:hypothetical protein
MITLPFLDEKESREIALSWDLRQRIIKAYENREWPIQ